MNKLKIIRDWLMVILTIIMLHSFYYVGNEIKEMRKELSNTGITINVMSKAVLDLRDTLKRSWFF